VGGFIDDSGKEEGRESNNGRQLLRGSSIPEVARFLKS
jgi:hypothetical protein